MNKLKDYLLLFLKGVGMGGADVVPGVSGGTIAFITGIYETLLDSIRSIDKNAIQLILKGKFQLFWQHINGPFLITLFSGILISIFSLVKLIHYLLEHHPIQLWSFFFGLIIISAILVLKEIKKWNAGIIIAGIIGIAVAYFITSATPATSPDNYAFIFLSGAIAICAMILPGISGSFILLILGKYEFIITAAKDFRIDIIAVFALGCVLGLLSFSRLISWLLKKYHCISISVLAGFMIGSLNKIWPWKQTLMTKMNRGGEIVPLIQKNLLPDQYQKITGNNPYFLQALLFLALGILIVVAIEKIASMMKHSEKSAL